MKTKKRKQQLKKIKKRKKDYTFISTELETYKIPKNKLKCSECGKIISLKSNPITLTDKRTNEIKKVYCNHCEKFLMEITKRDIKNGTFAKI